MALWLCRLRAEEQPDALLAQRMGIGAWVVGVDLLDETLSLDVSLEQGLPLVLEWHITGPLAADAELQAVQRWVELLRTTDFIRFQGRPLLLVHGTDWLSHPQHAGLRLKAALEAAAGESVWMLQRSGELTDHFDGVCEAVNLPIPVDASADRANYEVHLRDAHWRKAPKNWTIPAVRALLPQDHDCYCNASSGLYSDWLKLLSRWSELQCEGAWDAPVLIDSWEGHCLWWQPSTHSNKTFPLSVDPSPQLRCWGKPSADHLAVLVHGYYLDALARMLDKLPRDGVDLFVSTPLRQLPAVAEVLRHQNWPRVHLFGVPNRGRDMAPFLLDLLPAVQAVGHSFFIKLHTKSSPHLSDGEVWGEYLLNALLDPAIFENLLAQLRKDPNLGLIAPAGTLVPITLQLQNNGIHLLQLQRRTGIRGLDSLCSHFVAGSMFAGRVSVLEPLLKLKLQRNDFEPEMAQTDGTLAHSLERWIGVEVHHLGMRIDELPGDPRSMPGFGYRWSFN